jgi:hypothetical protein
MGEEGADTYVYAAGDGWDEIAEWDETPGEVDRLQLQGFQVGDVRVTRSPWNYYLLMMEATGSLLDMARESAASGGAHRVRRTARSGRRRTSRPA